MTGFVLGVVTLAVISLILLSISPWLAAALIAVGVAWWLAIRSGILS